MANVFVVMGAAGGGAGGFTAEQKQRIRKRRYFRNRQESHKKKTAIQTRGRRRGWSHTSAGLCNNDAGLVKPKPGHQNLANKLAQRHHRGIQRNSDRASAAYVTTTHRRAVNRAGQRGKRKEAMKGLNFVVNSGQGMSLSRGNRICGQEKRWGL